MLCSMYIYIYVCVCVLYVCILEFRAYNESLLEFYVCILYLLYILSLETFLITLAAYWSPFVTDMFKQVINLFFVCLFVYVGTLCVD